MRELKLISLDEYKEFQDLKGNKKINEGSEMPIVPQEMIPITNEVISNSNNNVVKDMEHDTKSELTKDNEKDKKIMPPPGLPIKKEIVLKRG